MKKLLTLVCLLPAMIFAQSERCRNIIKEQLIDKLYAPVINLAPYFEKNKWGFFNMRTGEKLTSPVFREAPGFSPDLKFYYAFETEKGQDGCNGSVSSMGHYQIITAQDSQYQIMVAQYNPPPKTDYSKKFQEKSGFALDGDWEFSHFNKKYFDEKENRPNIYNPIKFNGKTYAFWLHKSLDGKNLRTLIDSDGKEYFTTEKGMSIKLNYSSDTDIWVLIEDERNKKYHLQGVFSGKKVDGITEDIYFSSHEIRYFGYGIVETKKGKGIFDFLKMDWAIEPSKKNDFEKIITNVPEYLNIVYKSHDFEENFLAQIPVEGIKKNREKSNFFITTSKNIVLDFNLKEIQPKN